MTTEGAGIADAPAAAAAACRESVLEHLRSLSGGPVPDDPDYEKLAVTLLALADALEGLEFDGAAASGNTSGPLNDSIRAMEARYEDRGGDLDAHAARYAKILGSAMQTHDASLAGRAPGGDALHELVIVALAGVEVNRLNCYMRTCATSQSAVAKTTAEMGLILLTGLPMLRSGIETFPVYIDPAELDDVVEGLGASYDRSAVWKKRCVDLLCYYGEVLGWPQAVDAESSY